MTNPSSNTKIQIKQRSFLSVTATAVSAMMITTFGLLTTLLFKIIVVVALWLVVVSPKLLKKNHADFNPFHYFMPIKYFVLIMIVAISMDLPV